MTFLLVGEQLKADASKSKSGFRFVSVQGTKDLGKNSESQCLVCLEKDFSEELTKAAHTQGILSLVLFTKSTPAEKASQTLWMPYSFFQNDPDSALSIFLQFEKAWKEKKDAEKSLHSFGESHSQLADSTALLVQKLEQHLQIAAEIQRSLLPSHLPKIAGLTLQARFFPSLGVGGDYYDIFEFGDKKRFGFILADSQTHGMAAALLSALLKLRVEQIREEFPSAQMFISELCRHIRQEVPVKAADLHLFYGILDRSSLEMRFATAGNLRPLLWRDGKQKEFPFEASAPIKDEPVQELEDNVWNLQPGDYLVLHSRGMDRLIAPKTSAQWVGEQIGENADWPDLLDVQNELAAITPPTSELKHDVTLLQFTVDPRTLYLKK